MHVTVEAIGRRRERSTGSGFRFLAVTLVALALLGVQCVRAETRVLSRQSKVLGEVEHSVVSYVNDTDGRFNVGLSRAADPDASLDAFKIVVSFKQGFWRAEGFDISPSGRSLCLLLSRQRLGSNTRVYGVVFYRLREGGSSVFESQVAVCRTKGPRENKKALQIFDVNAELEKTSDLKRGDKKYPAVSRGSALYDVAISYTTSRLVRVTGSLKAGWSFVLALHLDEQVEGFSVGNTAFAR